MPFLQFLLLVSLPLQTNAVWPSPSSSSPIPSSLSSLQTSETGESETLDIIVVKEVRRPGTSYKPSTGKQLRVFQLDDSVLHGKFISDDNRILHYKSTCSGKLHIWRKNESNVIQLDTVSKANLISAQVEKQLFVFGLSRDNRTYHLPNHISKRDAEDEYSHPSDEKKLEEALKELQTDPDAHLLTKLSQALGEFGIYGSQSPCSLPLHFAALSISNVLSQNDAQNDDGTIDMEAFECAERNRTETIRAFNYPSAIGTRKRGKRFLRLIFRFVVYKVVRRILDYRPCTSNAHLHTRDCLGLCGKKCSCWSWVCGNCCYNRGCYEHDMCCKYGSSFLCTFGPLWAFDCDSYDLYPSCLY